MDPVTILVGGGKLVGWTEMKLKRVRKDMTGSLSFSLFYSDMPTSPVARNVVPGAEVTVYIAGNLAFTGKIEKRGGKGKTGGKKSKGKAGSKDDESGSISSSIDSTSYKISVSCRGKTRRLVDCSHMHPTGMMRDKKPLDVAQDICGRFGIGVMSEAAGGESIERVVYRDGAIAASEIHRWTREDGLYAFEDKTGQLKITSDGASGSGEDLILGQNILEFSSSQSDEHQASEITVKGQRTGPKFHGKSAIQQKETIKIEGTSEYAPFVIQLNGDAASGRMKRRGQAERTRRRQKDNEITIDVFHVQSRSGAPWDLNQTHYVEVPPEGIFGEWVVTELEYTCNHKDKIQTQLTLSPKDNDSSMPGQAGIASGSSSLSGSLLSRFASLAVAATSLTSDRTTRGIARMAQLGIAVMAGSYPLSWIDRGAGPSLVPTPSPSVSPAPPLLLPEKFK